MILKGITAGTILKPLEEKQPQAAGKAAYHEFCVKDARTGQQIYLKIFGKISDEFKAILKKENIGVTVEFDADQYVPEDDKGQPKRWAHGERQGKIIINTVGVTTPRQIILHQKPDSTTTNTANAPATARGGDDSVPKGSEAPPVAPTQAANTTPAPAPAPTPAPTATATPPKDPAPAAKADDWAANWN